MTAYLGRLPNRFPVGTKYVVECRPGGNGHGQVFSRHIEFPDGTFFALPVAVSPPLAPRTTGRRQRRSANAPRTRSARSTGPVRSVAGE